MQGAEVSVFHPQMKTPPDRSGIIFEVGAQLEARDRHKTWSDTLTHSENNLNDADVLDFP